MSANGPFHVHAVVRHALELPALQGSLQLLGGHMSEALRRPWPISFSYGPPETMPEQPPGLVLVSLLHEALPPHAPMAEVAERWHQRLEAFAALGAPVLLCNLFRHVPPQPFGAAGPTRELVLERVRRLNLLAIALSHRHAVDLADLDRTLACLGARPLQSDFRLQPGWGAAVAGDAIAGAMLQGEFPPEVPVATVQAAQASHGGHDGVLARYRLALSQGLRPEAGNAAR